MTEGLSDYQKKVNQHDKDLYWGNGKPGLTTRIFVLEEKMDTMQKAFEKMSRNSTTLVFLLISAILAAIGDVFVHAFHL